MDSKARRARRDKLDHQDWWERREIRVQPANRELQGCREPQVW